MTDYDLDEEEIMPEGHRIPEDLLPAEIPREIVQEQPKPVWEAVIQPTPIPAPISEATPLEAHINDDLEFYNTMLGNCRNQWKVKSITSIDEFCKLSLLTMKLLEGRRRAANKQLGHKGSGEEPKTYDV